jgi:hypothetical protein
VRDHSNLLLVFFARCLCLACGSLPVDEVREQLLTVTKVVNRFPRALLVSSFAV